MAPRDRCAVLSAEPSFAIRIQESLASRNDNTASASSKGDVSDSSRSNQARGYVDLAAILWVRGGFLWRLMLASDSQGCGASRSDLSCDRFRKCSDRSHEGCSRRRGRSHFPPSQSVPRDGSRLERSGGRPRLPCAKLRNRVYGLPFRRGSEVDPGSWTAI